MKEEKFQNLRMVKKYLRVYILKDHEGNIYTYSQFGNYQGRPAYWMTTSLMTRSIPPNTSYTGDRKIIMWDNAEVGSASGASALRNYTVAYYGYPRKKSSINQNLVENSDF